MREILFRGKSVDTGKWVFGSFIPDDREMVNGYEETGDDGYIKPTGRTREERLLKEEPKPVKLGNTNKTGKCGMCGISVPVLYPCKVGQVQFMICENCKSIMDM